MPYFSDLEEVSQPENKSSYFSDLGESKRSLPKTARLGAQYGIGNIERAALPYDIAVSPLSSKKAQLGEYRKNLFEDIERLSEQKQTGVWDKQDETLLQDLISQAKSPEKSKKYVQTADISSSGLIEKGAEKLGFDLKPQGIEEHAARIGGNILSPKNIVKGGKKIASLATKAGRESGQWKSLEKTAKGIPEKENMLNFSKQHKLTPKEATLLMRSRGKGEILEKTAKKTKGYKETVQGIKTKLGNNYEELKRLGKEGGYLSPEQKGALQGDLQKVVNDIDKTFILGPDSKAARTSIDDAIVKIGKGEGTIEELINSRMGLNEGINWKNIDRGDVFKKKADNAFFKAIERKDPSIAKRLKDTDKAYSQYKRFEDVLKKKSPVIKVKGVEVPNALAAMAFSTAAGFGPAAIKAYALKEGIQRLATFLVTSPKMQSPLKGLQRAIISGSAKKQKEAFLVIKKILQMEDPELSSDLEDLTIE